ncbi:PLC-like phosphodiesterase [Aaosphaeria arxii CBS 175.79]|uniref:Phosphoinositide phospholipase C n=1 Tax=Aaosphaeria arxii CBS 175.79 TaxID=1450172 RepID=A0A6A5XNI5_9PLEO|nr:PLC-like phosphodiesterase [Aaosphaeria arxii CBS 175.79]KAF2014798.1 PLC-like phosphodiesterase [Aaosphaeria arxii CBS 175.79]
MPSPQPSYARAINIPSRNSPASSPFYHEFNGSSLQSTPEGMVPVSHSSLPIPPAMHLPESLLSPPTSTPPTSSPSAMSEALSKGPGLIRRVSRGAQNIPNKFRRNGTNVHRDRSSGPVIMRRRSDSRTAADGALDVSDFDQYFEEEEAIEDFGEPINALGISSTSLPTISSIPDSTVTAPKRNSILEQGTVLMKATKKKQKSITLRLDLENAMVYWDESRPSKCFYIDDVKEIRTGLEAKHYREECNLSAGLEPLWFTIIYSDASRSKGRIKQMHLIARSQEIVELWTRTLDTVSRNRINMMAGLLGSGERSAKLVWQREMKKRFNGVDPVEEKASMDLPGIIALCRSLHINCSENTFRYYFDKADSDQTGSLDQSQFLYFVRRLKERKDVKHVYKRLLPEGHTEMDKDTFFAFLQVEQGINVDADLDHWTAVFEKSARSSKPRATPTEGGEVPLPSTMNFPAFQSFLTSPANSCFIPRSANLKHDRPLNEYFISSSHNTYLLGRQVVGESSTEAYITALQKGCRCVEVDCWNGRDGKPIVSHGRTFTTSISFLDTIKVINEYAFCESDYPLIISLEVHCNPEQQAIMSDIMKKEFGSKLVLEPLDDTQTLPSPEELKGKILIKVKAAAEEPENRALNAELPIRRRDRSFSSPFFRPQQLSDAGIPNSPLISSPPSMSPPDRPAFWGTPRTSTTSTIGTIPTSAFMSSAEDSDSPHTTEPEDKKKKTKSQTSKITRVLGELGVYTKGVKFTNFKSLEAQSYNHVFSFGEHTFNKLIKPASPDKPHLEEHNKRALMRVYPGYDRVTSSNFEPLGCWRRGVQMAALNWQTYDLGQQLNEAMFSGGDDRTGYVLKPAELRAEERPTPLIGNRKPPKRVVKFAVEIISAQQLPRPRRIGPDANINPYIEFEMHCAEDMGRNATGEGGQDASARNGLSGLGEPVRKRTRIVKGNGYNPEFNDRISLNLTTRYPSLVFVRWSVWNSRDAQNPERAPLATFTAKLSSLQQGYRHLPLFDSNGEQYLFSTLFCKIEKEEPMEPLPATIPEFVDSRRSSMESMNASQDPAAPRSSRNYLKRLVSRKNSGSKRSKDKEECTISSSTTSISRSSTFD